MKDSAFNGTKHDTLHLLEVWKNDAQTQEVPYSFYAP